MAKTNDLIRLLGGALQELTRYAGAATKYAPLARARTALSLYRDWEGQTGAFAEGADAREGLPVTYNAIYRGSIVFDARREERIIEWMELNPDIRPVEIKPGELIWRRADRIKPGDYLNLENDEIADPFGNKLAFESKLVQVAEVLVDVAEADGVKYGRFVRITIEGIDTFYFPPDHLLKAKPGKDTE